MAADVALDGGGVFVVVGAPEGIEAIVEGGVGEDEAVGDVDELAGVVVLKQGGQLLVLQGIHIRDLRQVGGDVVVGSGLIEGRQGELVDLAVEGGIVQGHHAHGLQPVGAGGLDMEDAPGFTAHTGEDGELVGAGVDGDLVAEVPGDLRMDMHFLLELGQVADVVDALLELAAEAGRQGGQFQAAAGQLIGYEEVLLGRGGGGGLVDGDLEVGALRGVGKVLVPDALGEVQGLGVDVVDLRSSSAVKETVMPSPTSKVLPT